MLKLGLLAAKLFRSSVPTLKWVESATAEVVLATVPPTVHTDVGKMSSRA